MGNSDVSQPKDGVSKFPDEMRVPPAFCQCAVGMCDQTFSHTLPSRGVFLYPSTPNVIANAIEGAITLLKHNQRNSVWRSWKDFSTTGQTIFCEICRQIRFADFVVADITTLNFNLLYEIGYAVGLELPVVPIRDTTYVKHRAEIEELGMLDTVGYLDFTNAAQLQEKILARMPFRRSLAPVVAISTQQPIYIMKGHVETDGELKLLAVLKKSGIRFRSFDVRETVRLSLHEARRQVGMSLGFVAHLLDPNREGALVHNARCALIAGIATSTGKNVLLLQEGSTKQPIDYRDLVVEYGSAERLEKTLEPFLRRVLSDLQDSTPLVRMSNEKLLEKLDLGDVAAENEIVALRSYFVRTAQFNDAKRGSGRLVTGRKGAGKSAIFYAVRNTIPLSSAHLALDLKPEGYQFTKLREAVLDELTHGFQEHTLMAFWEYILLCEMAHKIIETDHAWAQRDEDRRLRYERLRAVYDRQPIADAGDFSERLLSQVDALVARFAKRKYEDLTGGELTELLFQGAIRTLEAEVAGYVKHKESVWILVDNLDKSWPTRGAKPVDILIIRALLEATRKLQRQFAQRDVALNVLVFLRNDIYDLLLRQTSDRGKDTEIALDWNDPEFFREITRQRIAASTQLKGTFDDVWPQVFAPHIGVQNSFQYMLERTLMRPRDLLIFLKRAVETAMNRGHNRVTEEDILAAERSFSEDMLKGLSFELRDIYGSYAELVYLFRGMVRTLGAEEVHAILRPGLGADHDIEPIIEMLVWFSFFGVLESGRDEPNFVHQVRYNVEKLLSPIRRGIASFVIHPAFHSALSN